MESNIRKADTVFKNNKNRNTSARIIEELKRQRRMKGMTQQEVAEAAGIMRPNISRLEAGRNVPSLDVLIRYAEALGMCLKVELKEKDSDY